MNVELEPTVPTLARQHQRIAVYRIADGEKTLVARLTLVPDGEDRGHIQIQADSEQAAAKVREVVERVAQADQNQSNAGLVENGPLYKWTGVTDALKAEGFGVEDISRGDVEIRFEIDLLSGHHVGSQSGLHSFATLDEQIGRNVVAAIASAFPQLSRELAEELQRAIASADPSETIAAVRRGMEAGAFSMPPVPALLDALLAIDITHFDPADRRLIRECRMVTAQLLRRAAVAGAEAEALLAEESERLDDQQKADLEMIVANAAINNGHRETALHIWRKLLRSPETLGPGNRGWAWRNIALTMTRESEDARHAIKCSVDAFLEAGQKDEASSSLMMLAKSELPDDPALAIKRIDEILELIEKNGLKNRELRAATYHARARRLAQVGRHREAASDAQKAVEQLRGLIGAEEQLISYLHLAGLESKAAGDAAAAETFREEANNLTDQIDAPHFKLARRVEALTENFDSERAAELLRDAERDGNEEVIASVRVIQAGLDSALSDIARLSLLQDTLHRLDKIGASEGAKQPARIAMTAQLFRLGESERAEVWCRKILEADPFDHYARSNLVQSLWNREQWGDAAIFLKKEISRHGDKPGLLYAYGRSLFEAGEFSGAVSALAKATHLAGDNTNLKKLSHDLREAAFERGGTLVPPAQEKSESAPVTREEFDAAIDACARFISGDRRKDFWTKGPADDDYKWTEKPELRAQGFLHSYLKAKFGERVNAFSELDAGAGRLDLFAQFAGGLTVIIELKMCGYGYSSNYAAAGETQILHYMENRGSKLGYLVVFDARLTKSGEEVLSGENSLTVFSKFVDMRPRVSAR